MSLVPGGECCLAGEIVLLTHLRHAVLADEDSVFLLTTVTGVTLAPVHRVDLRGPR